VTDWKSPYDGVVTERDSVQRRFEQLESDLKKAKGLGTRERETLLKLVGGMAVAAYKHEPHATRTTTASAIVQDLDTVGISIDEDTVRKWLKEAVEHIPRGDAE
jgi:hypothetical protein